MHHSNTSHLSRLALACALTVGLIGAQATHPSLAQATSPSPLAMGFWTDFADRMLNAGDSLLADLHVDNPDSTEVVDVFLAALFPDGQVCFVSDLETGDCEMMPAGTLPSDFPKIAEDLAIPAGFKADLPNALKLTLPAGAPPGQYTEIFAVTQTDALTGNTIPMQDVVKLLMQDFMIKDPAHPDQIPDDFGLTSPQALSEVMAALSPPEQEVLPPNFWENVFKNWDGVTNPGPQ